MANPLHPRKHVTYISGTKISETLQQEIDYSCICTMEASKRVDREISCLAEALGFFVLPTFLDCGPRAPLEATFRPLDPFEATTTCCIALKVPRS
jgi:hypothetical protein